jgi:hypothetical protein
MATSKPSNKDLANELDEIAASLNGGQRRRLARVVAVLRGEDVALTPNEEREAARVAAKAEDAKAEAEALEAAAKATNG